jgi:hypothetical protein
LYYRAEQGRQGRHSVTSGLSRLRQAVTGFA